MYSDALEKIGLSANETVFIDDSENNLDGAARCGIQPVLITAKPNAKSSGRYPAVNSVSEIFKYL
jgi:putative hydrolase of the HAD superfamily